MRFIFLPIHFSSKPLTGSPRFTVDRFELTRQNCPKQRSFIKFRLKTYLSSASLNYSLTNGQSQSGSLCKLIQFLETMKHLVFFIFRNTDACIANIKMDTPVYLFIPHFNGSFRGIFDGISYKISENLCQPVLIQTNNTRLIRIYSNQTNLWIHYTMMHCSSQFVEINSQIKIFVFQFYRASFYFRKIQYVVNQFQQ